VFRVHAAAVLLLLAVGAASELRGANKNEEIHRHLVPSGTECVTYMRHMDFEDGSEEDSWVCEFNEQDAKEFGASAIEVTRDIGKMGAISGATLGSFRRPTFVHSIVSNSNGAVSKILYLPEDTEFEIVMMDEHNDVRHFRNRQRRRRRLAKGTTGDMKTLVVRTVDGANKSTDLAVAALEAQVFTDESCLASRYHDCSYGQLNIVNGGIVNIEIDEVALDNSYKNIETSVRNATYEAYGGSVFTLYDQFDLVMYCQPEGSVQVFSDGSTNSNWVAYAYVNHFESFFNNKWCGYVSGQVHEIGHNLGLGHSGLAGGSTYEDTSGMMGFSYAQDDGPDICFNAAKSYQLQWYTENNGVDSVDPLNLPGNSQTFDIIGVADYKTASGLVSLRLEYEGEKKNGKEWYVGYNHKSGINSGVANNVRSAPDTVHLIEKVNSIGGSVYDYGPSSRVVALEAGQEHTWKIGEEDVTLHVNSINGAVASVTIIGGPATNAPTLAPVPTISPRPTESPTVSAPTLPPTKEGECFTSDGVTVGLNVLIDIQLDDKSGSEFGWRLRNGASGQYWAGNNFKYENGARLYYGICAPKNTCYHLELEDTGGDGICGGNGDCGYKMSIGGEEVVAGDGLFGSGVSHRICVGTNGQCENIKEKFEYRKRKRSKVKRTTCRKILKKKKKRLISKFCKFFFGNKGKDRIYDECMNTCGDIGMGPCAFLENYEEISRGEELAAVSIDTIDHSP